MKTTQIAWQTSVVLLFLILGCSFSATAQTVQYVTLSATNTAGSRFSLQTNQVVSLVGYNFRNYDNFRITGSLPDGSQIDIGPGFGGQYNFGLTQTQQIITGLTNIMLTSFDYPPTPDWATFQITTPASANVVSNYVPADAIVIPSSATGNVQIILESSSDLVNWTAANPGTYGASSATNRFFRVRAVHN
jgi:hypothetical protein